jgi:hypothetical protein
MTPKTRSTGVERRDASPTHRRLTSVEAVLADAADLGLPDPFPRSAKIQHAVGGLHRLHRKNLPGPETGPWRPSAPPTAE